MSFDKYYLPKKCDGKCNFGYEFRASTSAYTSAEDVHKYGGHYGAAYEAADAKVGGAECVRACAGWEDAWGEGRRGRGKAGSVRPGMGRRAAAYALLLGAASYRVRSKACPHTDIHTLILPAPPPLVPPQVKGAVESTYNSYYGDDSYKGAENCRCVKMESRDAYAQKSDAPQEVASKVDMVWTESICSDGSAPDKKTNLCPVACPIGCVLNKDQRCEYPCPYGYKQCTYYGRNICTTQHNIFGCDSCEVMTKLWNHLEPSQLCPYRNTVIVAPKSAAVVVTPKVGTKPVVVKNVTVTTAPKITTVTKQAAAKA